MMNANKISKQITVFAIGFIGSLGEGCSDTQIVKTYLSNKEYYDSLSW